MFGSLLGPVAGALVGGLVGGKGGGGGTQTASKEPWEAVQPWLRNLISQGQDLSSFYSDNPFNPAQIAAYGNMANQGAYMRSLVPSLLGQVSSQPLSFDPANPTARPQAFQFGAGGGLLGQGGPNLGLLAGGGLNPVSTMPASIPKAVIAPPPEAPPRVYYTGNGSPTLDPNNYGNQGFGA